MRKAVLIILDGWGIPADPSVSAIDLGSTPFYDSLQGHYPSSQLEASGRAVGLPDGQMGNSEVGHMNLGAGRIVYQDLVRIDLALEDGSFAQNPVFADLAQRGASGMVGAPRRRQTRFADADLGWVGDQLADVIAELRPHVVVTYDPDGGYGHPDHIQAHRVTTAAIAAVADRWRVPKFYWTVVSAEAFHAGLESLEPEDVGADWVWPTGEVPFGFAEDQITAVIDAPEHLADKAAAIAAHATQVEVGPTGRAFALSNKFALPILGQEHYVLVSGQPGSTDAKGWEHDLLAGIDLDE